MLSLSFWAKSHPIQSWAIIALGRIILGTLALWWGFFLAAERHNYAKAIFISSAVFYLVGYVVYPKKVAGRHRMDTFARRKCCDALLVASSFLAWGGVGNFLPAWSNAPSNVPQEYATVNIPVLESAMARPFEIWHLEKQSASPNKSKAEKGVFFQKIKAWKQAKLKAVKASIRQNIALIRQATKALEGGTTALLVLASLLIFTLLGYLTAAIACNLSCNGQEGAASAVLILGCGATVGLIALMWASVVKKYRRKKLAEALSVTSPTTLPVHSELTAQVNQSELQVCIQDESPERIDTVSVFMGDQVLLHKVNLGNVPYCFKLSLNLDKPNALTIVSIHSEKKVVNKMKIFVDDGTEKNFFPVETEVGKRSIVHFQIKD